MDLTGIYGVAAGSILLPAAIGKLAAPSRFGSVLETLPMLSGLARPFFAYAIPVGEFGLGLWLILSGSTWSLLTAIALFMGFAIVNLYRWNRDGAEQELPCGCLGGAVEMRTTKGLIGINLVAAWLGLAILSLETGVQPLTLDPVFSWALGITLSGLYWLTSYAFSVLDMMSRSQTRKALQL